MRRAGQTGVNQDESVAFAPPSAAGAPAGFRIGEALVQPALNRISLQGQVTQVEPKVMQVLALLAARPGVVIAREEFFDSVWAGTVADDYLLNRAVSELRRILEDDPQHPRYIETIRKGGYRLIAPIAPVRAATAVPGATASDSNPTTPQSDPLREAARWRVAATGVVAAVVVLAAFVAWMLRPSGGVPVSEAAYDVRPLTSYVGREFEPALSPDGSRVAFIRDSGSGDFDLYVKTRESEDPLALTRSDADERFPQWTPDGASLLFARREAEGFAMLRISALGGGVTRVHLDPVAQDVRGMSLAPDGSRIAYARRESAAAPYRIAVLAFADSSVRELTGPEPNTLGDIDPRFARDGHSIVFVRGVNEVTRDLFRVSIDGGDTQRLTHDNRKINGLAWSPEGERLLFTSTRSGMYALWSIAPDGSDPVRVPLGSEDVHQPATAAGVAAIVFEQWTHRSRLLQIDLAAGRAATSTPLLPSTRWDSNAAWSPDGERIAFTSNRGGPHAIWVSTRDGRDAVQLAAFGGSFVDNPAWSPDGRQIAFDASPEGSTSIYVVSAAGGAPRRVVEGPGDARNPAWSRDGAWLYFESNRLGAWRIHAQPASGGDAVVVTDGPALNPRESFDGRHLLYTRPDTPGLWQRARATWEPDLADADAHGVDERADLLDDAGSDPRVIADLEPRDASNWAPGEAGIHFVRRVDGAARVVRFDPVTGSEHEVVELPADFAGWGFDLAPGEQFLLYSQSTTPESDLRVALPR